MKKWLKSMAPAVWFSKLKPRTRIMVSIWLAILAGHIHGYFESWKLDIDWFPLTSYVYDIQWYFADFFNIVQKGIYFGLVCFVLSLDKEKLIVLTEDKALKRTLFAYLCVIGLDLVKFILWAGHNWGVSGVIYMAYLILNLIFISEDKD